jgi:hypothetical protein
MSAIPTPASEPSVNYWLTLRKQLGLPLEPLPETQFECSQDIDGMRDQIPATTPQVNLCEKLIGDLYPGKALPANFSSKLASEFIETQLRRVPTQVMLDRCRTLEMQVQIDNSRAPRTVSALYEREREAKNRRGGVVADMLIDAKDAVKADWGLVDEQLAPATAYTEEDSQPESEGSVVHTNGRSKGPKA